MSGWILDDIPWSAFDPDLVDGEIVPLIKAACMVESNSADYAEYLCNVFADDPRLCRAARSWSVEEQQHGAALARWARLADPDFDFERAFAAFVEGYRIPVDATESVRGSRTGEMVARCMVETGTNSFYTALGDATREPVLKAVCRRIADDEMAHYWLFHSHMTRYMAEEKLSFWRRLRVALGRIAESEDDELAFAYYAANNRGEPYERLVHGRAYERRALAYYSAPVVRNAMVMVFEAIGLNGKGALARLAAMLASALVRARRSWLSRRPAAGRAAG